jgi:hypothetical protein
MLPAIWTSPEEIDAALARLGLTLAPLRRAVAAGYLARISCTANDAPNAPGYYHWNATLRGLREELVTIDWSRCDDGNFSTIVHPSNKVAIAVASGNEDTGIVEAVPTTRCAKGPNTAAAVTVNIAQLELFPIEAPPVHDGHERVTWFLLFYADRHELRAELSLPVFIDAEGQIQAWRERIILPSEPLESEAIIPEPDFGPEVDIDVRRRV